MKKELLENFIKQGMTQREIAEKVNKSQTSVKYWLNKYNIKTNNTVGPRGYKSNPSKDKTCPLCKTEKALSEFYKRKRGDYSGYCKQCVLEQTRERQRHRGLEMKIKYINLAGGKCSRCGYNKNLASLVFHHVKEETKEFELSMRELSGYSEKKIMKEFEKCIVLCHNCHSEEHNPHLFDWQQK